MSESPLKGSRCDGLKDTLAHLDEITPVAQKPTTTNVPHSGGSMVMDLETTSPVTLLSMFSPAADEEGKSASKSSSKKKSSAKKKAKSTTGTPKSPDDADDAPNNDTKKSSTPSSSTKSSPSSKSKTYLVMAHEAIVDLKDRSGSSQIAIAKHMLSTYPELESNHFKSRLSLALKSGTKSGRFTKIRASYKINTEWTKKEKAKKRAAALRKSKKDKKKQQAEAIAKKQERERKKKETLERKQKEMEKTMTEEELAVLREKKALKQEAERRKKEAAARAKEIAERTRKRRFPMEDTALHKEDKELGVKPPEDVKRRPALPCFMLLPTVPFDKRPKGKKVPSAILSASRCDNLDYGSRGLASDLIQVFHFFRGDVAYSKSEELLVPEFTMKHLVHAVDEILNGNAKRSRMVPPLISHLFVTALRLLTAPPSLAAAEPTRQERQLQADFAKLATGLGPASWAEVCFQYMDAMERFYSTTASVDPNVLPGGFVDMKYLMRATNEVEQTAPLMQQTHGVEEDVVLPLGYCAYLGDPRSSLSKAHAKLEKQDPWNLSAEELMALLRALTDDILSSRDEIAEDIARRDEEMYELLKAKKAADSQFRKTRLAYEGPKRPSKGKSGEKADKPSDGEKAAADADSEEPSQRKTLSNEASEDVSAQSNGAKKDEDAEDGKQAPKFKPTATKKQFEAARKNQIRANDAYDKGLRGLVSRREPVGYDRNHNAVYFFNHDPDVLYVEVFKAPAGGSNMSLPVEMQMKRSTWHVIDTKSLFDQFVQSLDIRGSRENELYEALLGPVGGSYSLRRGLFDDIKERNAVISMQKDREELERRLANARIACAAEEEEGGRRSGRLVSRAQMELSQVEEEISKLERRMKAAAEPKLLDYNALTGLEMLRKFDNVGRRETRRLREKKEESEMRDQPNMPCSIMWCTGNIDGSGIVGSVISDMLGLEEFCESLSPWERGDVSRKSWIANVEDVVHAWNGGSPPLLGPNAPRDLEHPTPASTDLSQNDKEDDDADKEDSKGTSPMTPEVGSKRVSTNSAKTMSDGKRRKLDRESPSSTTSSVVHQSVSQILGLLKPPLLDLEERVFEITGHAMASRDADEADDNMSVGSNEDEETATQEGREQLAWKKKVHSLVSIPTIRYGQIREVLVEAIAAARKAQLGGVVGELRSALLLHHPNAAGACKAAAIAALERHGGYHEEDDESSDESEADEYENEAMQAEDEALSVLSGEAMMINGSLSGDEHANRIDWIDAVKGCKTMSRFAALAFAFFRKGSDMLKKIQGEEQTMYEALEVWEKEDAAQRRARSGKPAKKKIPGSFDSSTEVWANVRFTDEFCMAKLEGFPAWPAKKCEAKDPSLARSLTSLNRVLVSLFGEEGGLRVIKSDDIHPFTGKTLEEDLNDYNKDLRTQLDECLAMARRIVRGRTNKTQRTGRERSGYMEEKKSAA